MTEPLAAGLSPRRLLGTASRAQKVCKDVKATLKLHSISGHTVSTPRQVDTCALNSRVIYAAGSIAVLYDLLEGRQVAFLSAQNKKINVRRGSTSQNVGPATTGALRSPAKLGQSSPIKATAGSNAGIRPRAITCVAAARTGGRYAVGELGHMPRVLVFDCRGDITHAITGHEFGIQAVAFSPDGQYVATLGFPEDGYLHIWRLESGAAIKCQSNRLISGTNFLLWLHQHILISGGVRYIRIWDIHHAERGAEEVTPLESRNLILGDWLDNEFVSAQPFGAGIIVLSKSGLLLKCEALKSREPQVRCASVSVTSEGQASMVETRAILVEGDSVSLAGTAGLILGRSDCERNQISWQIDSSTVKQSTNALAGSSACQLIFTESRQIFSTKNGLEVTALGAETLANQFPDQSEASARDVHRNLHKVAGATCSLSLGSSAIYGFEDGSIVSSSLQSSVTLQCCNSPLTFLACCGDDIDGLVAVVAKDRTVRIIKCQQKTLSMLQILKGHTSSILAIAFAASGQYLLTCGADHKTIIYDRTIDAQDNLPFYEIRDNLSFQCALTSLSVDGLLCYIAADKEVAVVDIPLAFRRTPIRLHHLDGQSCIAAKVVAKGNILVVLTNDKYLQVYAAQSKSLLHEVVVNCESSSTLQLDGSCITTGSADTVSTHWQLVTEDDPLPSKVRAGVRIPSLSRSISSPALREMLSVRSATTHESERDHISSSTTRREPLGRSSLNQTSSPRPARNNTRSIEAKSSARSPSTTISPRKSLHAMRSSALEARIQTDTDKVLDAVKAFSRQLDALLSELGRFTAAANIASSTNAPVGEALSALHDRVSLLLNLVSSQKPMDFRNMEQELLSLQRRTPAIES